MLIPPGGRGTDPAAQAGPFGAITVTCSSPSDRLRGSCRRRGGDAVDGRQRQSGGNAALLGDDLPEIELIDVGDDGVGTTHAW